MESLLKRELNTVALKTLGHAAGGCISQGQSYETDSGRVFVKINHKSQVHGYIRRTTGRSAPSQCNAERTTEERCTYCKGPGQSEMQYVNKFGFHIATCCGYLPQHNDWQSDWVNFFTRQRLQVQLDLIEKEYADREARDLWSKLQLKIPALFHDMEIMPALLHGDLWGGNIGQVEDGPVIFDPASFYGHSEFELAISGIFGGFGTGFYTAYHNKIPKAPGFEKRLKLYQLFHYLNHWNHFGSGYRGSSVSIMKALIL
ncbi:ketosamine-3-kinase isoform X3 [Scyliorhinus torazame]|uniref:ketosamine-3-kinase isoform X3 n=1 Tax=Scyliorhinus torazame TaxID=75743 RepID=UPI003B59107E